MFLKIHGGNDFLGSLELRNRILIEGPKIGAPMGGRELYPFMNGSRNSDIFRKVINDKFSASCSSFIEICYKKSLIF